MFKNIWISLGFDVNVNAGDSFVSDLKDCECTEAEIWPRHHDVCSSTYIFRDSERKTSPKNFHLLKEKRMEDERMNTKICAIWTRDTFKRHKQTKERAHFPVRLNLSSQGQRLNQWLPWRLTQTASQLTAAQTLKGHTHIKTNDLTLHYNTTNTLNLFNDTQQGDWLIERNTHNACLLYRRAVNLLMLRELLRGGMLHHPYCTPVTSLIFICL